MVQSNKDASPRTQEARMRNSKFLAELTKFRLCPYGNFFTMLKVGAMHSIGHISRADSTNIAPRVICCTVCKFWY